VAQRAESNGIELAYERSGEGGLPVVLVHGLGGRREVWSAQREGLAGAGFDAIAIDMRGHGDSARPAGPYSVELWAADLVGLLDALELERAALIGHSIGCTVVEHAALELGERCPALAMLGGALGFGEAFRATLRERAELARAGRMREIGEAVAGTGLTERAHAERPELVSSVVDLIASNDPECYAASALATAEASMRDPGRLSAPALAFAGSEDPVGPPRAAEEIAAAMPSGESAVVEGGAHMCMIEASERTTTVLREFLQRTATG